MIQLYSSLVFIDCSIEHFDFKTVRTKIYKNGGRMKNQRALIQFIVWDYSLASYQRGQREEANERVYHHYVWRTATKMHGGILMWYEQRLYAKQTD